MLAVLINASPTAVQLFAILATLVFAGAVIYAGIKREVWACVASIGFVALAIAAICTV